MTLVSPGDTSRKWHLGSKLLQGETNEEVLHKPGVYEYPR